MKNLIAIFIMLVAVGCGKSFTNEDVVGTYERKEGDAAYSLIFRGNGVVEEYENGKLTVEAKWTIKSGNLNYFLYSTGIKIIIKLGRTLV